MNRSLDLDTIAPDDPIFPIKKEKKKKIKKDVCRSDYKTPNKCNPAKIKEIIGYSTSSLSSILVCPTTFNFTERNKDEDILVVLRPHWFANVYWISLAFVLIIAPFFFDTFGIKSFLPYNILNLLLIFWYLFTFAFVIEKFISWYYDLSIITNQRVIDIDVANILDRRFRQAQLRKIQNTSYKILGISQAIFNYGTIRIETAGENPNLVFEHIASPQKIAKLLQNLYRNKLCLI
jgi:hypothetical protein